MSTLDVQSLIRLLERAKNGCDIAEDDMDSVGEYVCDVSCIRNDITEAISQLVRWRDEEKL